MSFKIVRNDITKMCTEAIVNTANDHPTVGTGCDYAIYMAAGYDELLAYRKRSIGYAAEGDAFITPGFRLQAKYIIHAVSPLYKDGKQDEEEKLRSCYRKSLAIAVEHGIKSISIPLIATGGFGYPKEEGMRIAIDEIQAFLLKHEMEICLVVFDEKAAQLSGHFYPDLEEYIDHNYVQEKSGEEYGGVYGREREKQAKRFDRSYDIRESRSLSEDAIAEEHIGMANIPMPQAGMPMSQSSMPIPQSGMLMPQAGMPMSQSDIHIPQQALQEKPKRKFRGFRKRKDTYSLCEEDAFEELEKNLAERMRHRSDTFPQYLLYLIKEKGMENAEVYKRAIVDKKVFSKIKNNPDYHPQKITALCLCVGAKLNLDESRDLLARAGYALSPCDKTDIIFSYFIEKGIYDMIELDIQLEEHGLPCIIS